MMWIKWILLITTCLHTLGIRQPYRPVNENTTCLEIKKESRLSCNNKDQFYHCLLDENYTKEFEVCKDWKWIPGGKSSVFVFGVVLLNEVSGLCLLTPISVNLHLPISLAVLGKKITWYKFEMDDPCF